MAIHNFEIRPRWPGRARRNLRLKLKVIFHQNFVRPKKWVTSPLRRRCLAACGRRVKNVWSRCPSVLKLTWWLCENTNWLIKLVQRSDCWRCADKPRLSPGQGLTLQTHRRDKAVKCSSPQLMTRPLKPKSIAVLRHHPLKRSLDSRFLQILDLGLRNAGH